MAIKIAIMGSGGIGGYYGGLLAKEGHEVHFVARGAHLAAMRENGLRVFSLHGDFNLESVSATDDPSTIGRVDLVMMSTKTPEVESAAEAVKPIVDGGTTVLSLQNGVEAPWQIGAVVGIERVLAGATWVSSMVEAPGVIRQVSLFRRIVFGELDGGITPRAEQLAKVLGATGTEVEATNDIQKVLWTKFVFIAALSGVGSLTRLPLSGYRDIPETRALLRSIMEEVEAVGRAVGVSLDSDVVEQAMGIISSAVPSVKASMQRDVEAGRRSELESMIGVVGRKGREVQVPTPTADFVYAALLPLELEARR